MKPQNNNSVFPPTFDSLLPSHKKKTQPLTIPPNDKLPLTKIKRLKNQKKNFRENPLEIARLESRVERRRLSINHAKSSHRALPPAPIARLSVSLFLRLYARARKKGSPRPITQEIFIFPAKNHPQLRNTGRLYNRAIHRPQKQQQQLPQQKRLPSRACARTLLRLSILTPQQENFPRGSLCNTQARITQGNI